MRADRQRDLRCLPSPDISAHGEVDGEVWSDFPAFFLLDLDFLPFGGCSLTRSLKQTLRLLRATRANLLTIVAEVDYPRTSYWLISLRVDREEITVSSVPL
jgi:hypothetical protein